MAGAAPFAGGPAGSTAGRGGRLLGVDLARLLALLGMFATHLIVPVPDDGPGGVDGLFQLAAGRSSALFALLAGVSLAIVTRGIATQPGASGSCGRIRCEANMPSRASNRARSTLDSRPRRSAAPASR